MRFKTRTFTRRGRASPLLRKPVNTEAYEAYLKGSYFAQKAQRVLSPRKKTIFNRPFQLDPGYAPAYAALSDFLRALSDALPPAEALAPRPRGSTRKRRCG